MQIRFLLDTSVCVPVLRGQTSRQQFPASMEMAVSSVVAAELWAGANKAQRREEQLAMIGSFL